MASSDHEGPPGGLRHGDHACVVCAGRAEQVAAAVRFLAAGLAAGDRCVYVADGPAAGEVSAALAAAGVDVLGEQGRGALLLAADWHSLLHSGDLDPARMIGLLRQAAGRARADGFAGLRVAAEMDGPPGGGAGRDRLLEYEALLNDALPGSGIVVACQYDRRRGDAAVLRDALRTHPLAVLGERACSNPFCEPPGVVLGGDEAGRVEWMLGRLRSGEEEAAERRRVEQSLRTSE